ncbi:DUF167 domain-containing protein [Erythrobacter sp. EC-HK427]|uniref:DUF167 domain-containing protein n=1 Tax=Erythrobacter sp. EC-HK427 TaxID=2038396 RepID=UPI00125AC22D|nr:DUF167 domain-containing protein [Erythrobacter sp. EC-HK427]VVT03694.1 conserved hypothetical protein [Erythrobacter sp. EC-HK427]
MAKPKADTLPAEALRALADERGRLAVRVTPGARSETLQIADGRLLAKVRAKPQDGAANVAVIALLAKTLAIAPTSIELLRGATSREKLFQLPG